MTLTTVYVLLLEDSCFYVNSTEEPEAVLHQHFTEPTVAWLKLHKPIKILGMFSGDKFLAKSLTLLLMNEYGWKNVRGYAWLQTGLTSMPNVLKDYETVKGQIKQLTFPLLP